MPQINHFFWDENSKQRKRKSFSSSGSFSSLTLDIVQQFQFSFVFITLGRSLCVGDDFSRENFKRKTFHFPDFSFVVESEKSWSKCRMFVRSTELLFVNLLMKLRRKAFHKIARDSFLFSLSLCLTTTCLNSLELRRSSFNIKARLPSLSCFELLTNELATCVCERVNVFLPCSFFPFFFWGIEHQAGKGWDEKTISTIHANSENFSICSGWWNRKVYV